MRLSPTQQANLTSSAREFAKSLQRLAIDWPENKNLSKKLKVLREEAYEGLELTQGRADFWRRAETCAQELSDLFWQDKWEQDGTWLLLRSYSRKGSSDIMMTTHQSFDLEES